jgi:hypothetical protein
MRAFLAVFQALAGIECQAARQAGIDPGRISFTVTIRIARDHARTQHALLIPGGLARARQHAITDMLAGLLPPRRDRHYDREKKRPRNNYPTRKTTSPGHPPTSPATSTSPRKHPASPNTLNQRHYARTHWIRGFMAFWLARRTRTAMLMMPVWPESGFRVRAARAWPIARAALRWSLMARRRVGTCDVRDVCGQRS